MQACFRFLLFCFFLGLGSGTQQIAFAQGSISVFPNIVDTGTSPAVTISASGFFDLTEVQQSQISIRPSQGVSNLKITWATAQQLKLSFTLAEDAAIGVRTLLIKNNSGETIVALDLALRLGPHICRPACPSPQTCVGNVCVGCRPPCPEGKTCVGSVCRPPPRPPICIPPCPSIQICNEFGRCETPK